MKNISYLSAVLFLAVCSMAMADPTSNPSNPTPPPQCKILRQANAIVTIKKVYWEQDNGIWVQKTDPLASTNNQVPVYQESSVGCTVSKILELDNVNLNGVTQTIRAFGYIAVQDANLHKVANKIFSASYWVSTDNGHSAFAQAFTPDLTTKQMGVVFNKERAAVSETAHEDTVNVQIFFDDSVN